MFFTGQGTIPVVFQSRFKRVTHSYSTRFRVSNFSEKSFKFNQTTEAKFSVSTRRPNFWNKVLRLEKKHILSEYLFNSLMCSGNICYHFLFQYYLLSTGYQTKSSCDEHSRMM